MAPPGTSHNLHHRVRALHPLGWPMRHSLRRTESLSAPGLARYQERRLRWLVRVAARSPYYREQFQAAGIEPRDIRTLADLPSLPLLERAALMAHSERLRTFPAPLMWPARSSGTSGRVVTCYRTPGSSVFEQAILQRQAGWFGVPRLSRRVVMRGNDFTADRPGAVTMAVPGARQLLVSSYHLNVANLPRILKEILDFGPDAVEGWPSSLALLANLIESAGTRLPVRGIVTSSETMTPCQIALLRRVFAGPLIDYYGQTERVAMAGTCERGGYHVFPDYGIVELLPVPARADRWEIVGTPLHNWGFPLLRYRTGDEVGPAPDGPCPCGRAFPRIGAVSGRVEDSFTAADGRVLPLPSSVVDDLPGLLECQIAQVRPGSFEVRLVPGPGYDPAAIRAQARLNMVRLFGAGNTLTFHEYGTLPRGPSGKLKTAVVENRPSP